MQSTNGASTAIYLTADANGIALAPATPGTLFIPPVSITTNSTTYPSLQPVIANQRAFEVSAPIPLEFTDSQVNVYFDLFDNLNALPSQAWFSDLRVIEVPEPSILALLLTGIVLGMAAHRHRK